MNIEHSQDPSFSKSFLPRISNDDIKQSLKSNHYNYIYNCFLFSIILQRATETFSPAYTCVMHILDAISFFVPPVYPLMSLVLHQKDTVNEFALNPGYLFFKYINNALGLDSDTLFMIELALMVCFNIIFIIFSKYPSIAFKNFEFIRRSKIFDPRLHSILIPLNVCSLGYIVFNIYKYDLRSKSFFYFCLFIINFGYYSFAVSLLMFFNSASFLSPSIFHLQMFNSKAYLTYLIRFVSAFFCMSSVHFSSGPMIIMALISILLFLSYVIIYVKKLPMMLFYINEYYASSFTNCIFMTIISTYSFYKGYVVGLTLIFLNSFLLASFFLFYSFLISLRNKPIRKLLSKIDSLPASKQYFFWNLIQDENQVCRLLKEGLLADNKIILSEDFISFCLKKHPNNPWIKTFLIFYLGLGNNFNANTYSYLLSLLDSDKICFLDRYLIFQIIFCCSQISEQIPPILIRELDDYRNKLFKYLSSFRNLWKNVVTLNEKDFYTNINNLSYYYSKVTNEIRALSHIFPYSPSVLFEKSIYFSDFAHNIEKSSKEYAEANLLIKTNIKYISNSFYKNLSSFFYFLKFKNEENVSNDGTCSYLTLKDVDSQPSVLFADWNDQYIQFFPKIVTKKAKSNKTNPAINLFKESKSKWLHLFTVLVMLVCMAIHIIFYCYSRKINEDHEKFLSIINETFELRDTVPYIKENLIIICDIVNESYKTLKNSENFLQYMLSILSKHFQKFINSSLFNIDYKEYSNVSKIIFNSTYISSYTQLKECSEIFLNSKNENLISGIDKYMIKNNSDVLSLLLDDIYYETHDCFQEVVNNKIFKIRLFIILILFIDLVFLIVMPLLHSFNEKKLFNLTKNIICTAQPSIINKISCCFEHVLNETKWKEKKEKKLLYISLSFVTFIVFLIYFIYPFILIVFLYTNDYKINPQNIKTNISWNDDLDYLFYSMAEKNYMFQNNNITLDFDRLINISNDQITHSYCFFNKFEAVLFYTSKLILLNLIMLFIWKSRYYYSKLEKKSMINLLSYLPSYSWKTNYAYYNEVNGEKISNSNLNQFISEIYNISNDFGFFFILYFDNDFKIINTIGNPKKIIGTVSKTLNEFVSYLSSQSSISHDEIYNYFLLDDSKEKEPLVVPFREVNKLLLTYYSKEKCLLVQDISHKHEINKKNEFLKRISIQKEKLEHDTIEIKKGILLFIDSSSYEVKSLINSYPKFNLIDSRYNRMILYSEINDEENSKLIIHDLLEILNKLHTHYPFIKAIVHYGGPFIINQQQTDLPISRCYGFPYTIIQILKSQLRNLPFITLTEDFVNLSNLKNNEFTEIEIDSNHSIKITSFL